MICTYECHVLLCTDLQLIVRLGNAKANEFWEGRRPDNVKLPSNASQCAIASPLIHSSRVSVSPTRCRRIGVSSGSGELSTLVSHDERREHRNEFASAKYCERAYARLHALCAPLEDERGRAVHTQEWPAVHEALDRALLGSVATDNVEETLQLVFSGADVRPPHPTPSRVVHLCSRISYLLISYYVLISAADLLCTSCY